MERWPRLRASIPASDAVRVSGVSLVGFVLLWQLASTLWVPSILFPTPLRTLLALVAMLREGVLPYDAGVSLSRIAIGFLIGTVVGVPLGLAMGLFRPVLVFFEPYVQFFRFVPPVAWIIPAILWFGIGETSKLFLVVYATIFVVLVNTIAGVTHVHRDLVRMAQAFGGRGWQIFVYITLPATVPFILSGMRIAMGNSFMTVIGAELLAGNNGLGYLIYSSRVFFNSDVMFAAIVVLGTLGFTADRIFHVAQHRLFWRYRPGRP